jgi:hypothetical protein
MAKQPEARLTEKVMFQLKRHSKKDGWWVKIHGGPFQQAGIPDIIGCYKGRFVAIEVKVPGKEGTMSAIQRAIFSRIRLAGGVPHVVTSVTGAMELLRYLDENIELDEKESQ